MPDIQFGTKIVKHLKNGKVFEDNMNPHNVQIQNDQNSTYVHKRGSSAIDLVLAKGISNLKCQRKEFDLMNTCHKAIITTSQNIRPIISNKKIQNQGYQSKCMEN